MRLPWTALSLSRAELGLGALIAENGFPEPPEFSLMKKWIAAVASLILLLIPASPSMAGNYKNFAVAVYIPVLVTRSMEDPALARGALEQPLQATQDR